MALDLFLYAWVLAAVGIIVRVGTSDTYPAVQMIGVVVMIACFAAAGYCVMEIVGASRFANAIGR